MGLDMYAVRRTFIRQWEGQPSEEQYEISIKRGGQTVATIDPTRITAVDEEVMYWRKANHIHGFFDYEAFPQLENCTRYRIPTDVLKSLLETCHKVIEASELVDGDVGAGTLYSKDHPEGLPLTQPGKVIKDPTVAKHLLPTRTGPFFGSQDYDEHYLEDVVATRDWLERHFKEVAQGASPEVYYYASW